MIVRGKWLLWMRAFLHSAAIAGLVLIAASWFVAAYISSVEREKAVEEAMKQSDSLVRLFEHDTVETIGRFDRTLLLLRKSYEDDPAYFDLRKWAEQTALISEEAILLTLIDPDGQQKATTLNNNAAPVYLGDRPHVKKQLQATDDELLISDPVMGRTTKRMSIVLLRRLRYPDGSTAGLITLSIDPNFIEPFYRSVDLGSHGGISMRNHGQCGSRSQGVFDRARRRQADSPDAGERIGKVLLRPLLGARRYRRHRSAGRLPQVRPIPADLHGGALRRQHPERIPPDIARPIAWWLRSSRWLS